MKTKQVISIEDMTNWLHAQRITLMTEGNLYEEIIVAIIKTLKEYDQLKQAIKIMGELQENARK